MILVREDHQTARDPTPTVPTSISHSTSHAPAEHVLLQDVEGADALRLREPVVLAAMYDQHRRGPLVNEVRGVVSTNGARVSLIPVPCPTDTAAEAEHVLCEVRLRACVPRPATPLFVELHGRHVRARTISRSVKRDTHEKELVSGVAVVRSGEDLEGQYWHRGLAQAGVEQPTPSWQTRALKLKLYSGCPWIQLKCG